MTQTQTFIAHIVIVVVVVTAAIVLAWRGTINGATAITMIASVVGISLGAVVSTNGAATATNAQTAGSSTPVAVPTPTPILAGGLAIPAPAAPAVAPILPA